MIDFLALLFGYAISGERTLEASYECLQPRAMAFMALFGRDRLPSRSALSRWLGALDQATVKALCTLFPSDLLARGRIDEEPSVRLGDQMDSQWLVFDGDGKRDAARQRALPPTPERPVAKPCLRPSCAPGSPARKRGEIVRTRRVGEDPRLPTV